MASYGNYTFTSEYFNFNPNSSFYSDNGYYSCGVSPTYINENYSSFLFMPYQLTKMQDNKSTTIDGITEYAKNSYQFTEYDTTLYFAIMFTKTFDLSTGRTLSNHFHFYLKDGTPIYKRSYYVVTLNNYNNRRAVVFNFSKTATGDLFTLQDLGNASGGTLIMKCDDYAEVVSHTITHNLTNCSITPTDTSIADGTETTFTVTANDGFRFDTAPTINGAEMAKTSDTVYTSTITVNADITITATANEIPDTKYYSVTSNLTNCSITPTNTSIADGTETTFIVTANDGFRFDTAPTINGAEMTKTSDTVYTSTITVNSDVTITAIANEIPVINVTFTYGELTNCTCNYNNGEKLNADKSIIFTANNGYYFNSYNITWVDSEGLVLSKTLNGETATFLTKEEITDYINKNESIEIHDVTAIKKPIDIINGVNIYSITNEELVNLMYSRFVVESDDSINDFGKYITNLYILPFDITEIIGDETNIILGTRNSGTKANILNKNSLAVSLGAIAIPNYENAYEMNATYRLYLPFVNDVITLDTEFIVNHTVNITYYIDLIEETITVILTNEENTEPFYYNKYNSGRNLPFFNTENGNTNLQYSNNISNNIMTAFIIKTVNNAYDDNSKIGKNTYIYDVISNYKGGYIECENIKLEGTTITDDEKNELDTILRNGVYINE